MNKFLGLVRVDCDEFTIKKELRCYGSGYKDSLLVVDCFRQQRGDYFVPKCWAAKKGFLTEENDNRPSIEIKWPDSEFTPRHNQLEVVEGTVEYLKKNISGRISAPTGYGKTYCALQIAKKLKTNVLYLVHKNDVLKQVKQTAKNFFGIDKCGEIKGSKCEISEIVTLCTMQTMAKRVKEDPEWLSNFGLAIYDESHRSSCNSYVNIMEKINCTYMLGISATHRRSDGLEGVWDNFMGGLIIKGVKDAPRIPYLECPLISNTGLSFKSFVDWSGDISHVNALTKIAENTLYNEWIIARILRLLKENRRPIVCTDRKQQLCILERMLNDKGILSVGIYAGGKHKGPMTVEEIEIAYLKWHRREAVKKYKKRLRTGEKYTKKKFDLIYEEPALTSEVLKDFYEVYEGDTLKEADLIHAMKQDVILATTKKIGEGFDFEMFLGSEAKDFQEPDTIILCSMTKDSSQVIGRISRSKESKHPLIIQPIIDIGYCQNIFRKCWNISYRPVGIKQTKET